MRYRSLVAVQSLLFCLGLLLAASLPLHPASAQQQSSSALLEAKSRGSLKVGWAVFYPYIYRDPKSETLNGFAVDFMTEMANALNLKVEWVEDSWATMIAGLQSRKYDVTLPGLAITLPRAEAVTFTKPVARMPLGLMVLKKDVGKYQSWIDLDKPDMRITTTLGSVVDMFATQKFNNAQIIRVKAGPDSIAQVMTGKADAWANGLEGLRMVERENPELATVPGPDFGANPIALAVRQGDFLLRDWINIFIDDKQRTGALKKMLDKHGLFEWKEPS